ncbi:hypothetical protein JCM5353_006026, partial [Sporobolomyces roseus]
MKTYGKQIRPPRQANPHSAIPTLEPFETALYTVQDMLREQLVVCPARVVDKPTANDAQLLEPFNQAFVHRASWNKSQPPAIAHEFLKSVYAASDMEIDYRPQLRKLIESEGDIGRVLHIGFSSKCTHSLNAGRDLALINILSPVTAMLNDVIDPRFRQHLVVTIQHQTSCTPQSST